MADLSSTKIYGRLTVIHDAILKANAAITGNVNVVGDITASNATFSNVVSASSVTLTGDIAADTATITNALSAGTLSASSATLTGNLGVVDVNASGDLYAVNTTLTGNLSVVDINGANITLTGNLGVVDVNASGNVTATGNVNATNATLTGNLGVVGVTASGDISATNGTLTGDLDVANVTASGNLGVVDVNASGIVSGNGSGLTNVNAETLDGVDSTSFVRSDQADTLTGATYLFSGKTTTAKVQVGDTSHGISSSDINGTGSTAPSGTPVVVHSGPGGSFAFTNDDGTSWPFFANADGNVYASGEFYANGNLVWNQGNMGTGSGLDADTVDGIEGSQIVRNDQTGTINGNLTLTGDLTLGSQQGVVIDYVSGTKNPVFTMKNYPDYGLFWDEGSPDTFQISTTGELTDFALEINREGLTRKGFTVWDSGNHGPGSTLDADTVDGLHASQFVRNDSEDQKVVSRFHVDSKSTGPNSVTYIEYRDAAATRLGYVGLGSSQNPDLIIESSAGNVLVNDTYGTAQEIWHAGNVGPGSGLDADTLDGKQLTTIEQDAESAALALAIALG